MSFTTPTLPEVQKRLKRLNQAGIRALSELSGTPFMSIMKIRCGLTKQPGYETVRSFLPFVAGVMEVPAHHSREYRAEQSEAAKKSLASSKEARDAVATQ